VGGTLTLTITITNPAGGGTTTFTITTTVVFAVLAPTSVTDSVGCANSNDPTLLVFPSTAGVVTGNAVTAGVGLTLVPPVTFGGSSLATTAGGFFPFVSAV